MVSTEILSKLNELAQLASDTSYLYRGESKINEFVSSRLFRDHQDYWQEGWDIERIQQEEIREAKRFTHETDDFAILTEIQHYGGSTNLIDFTTDYLIALFFACDGNNTEDGRIIFLKKNSNSIPFQLNKPNYPVNRVIAQKSIFVRPPKGYIEAGDYETLSIPHQIKKELLEHLQKAHGISTEIIYNDLHGFIRDRTIHRVAVKKFYEGLSQQSDGEHQAAIDLYSESIASRPYVSEPYNNRAVAYQNLGDFESAVNDYDYAIEASPTNFTAFYNRGTMFMAISFWGKAKIDLLAAEKLGFDVADAFHEEYADIEDFELKYNVKVPPDILEILKTS